MIANIRSGMLLKARVVVPIFHYKNNIIPSNKPSYLKVGTIVTVIENVNNMYLLVLHDEQLFIYSDFQIPYWSTPFVLVT